MKLNLFSETIDTKIQLLSLGPDNAIKTPRDLLKFGPDLNRINIRISSILNQTKDIEQGFSQIILIENNSSESIIPICEKISYREKTDCGALL